MILRHFPDYRRLTRITAYGGDTAGDSAAAAALGDSGDAGGACAGEFAAAPADMLASLVSPAPVKNPTPPLGGVGHTDGLFKRLALKKRRMCRICT